MPGAPAGTPPAGPGESPVEVATRVFADHRQLLFSLIYNMLGSVADTEDVLQETWLAWVPRWQDPAAEEIASPRAYLVRIAVNRALAQLATISRRREDYTGPWCPSRSSPGTRQPIARTR
jgi:DNA-directed RNA polymerase specialized sigma24 family protein